MTPDAINGAFEFIGAGFLALNVRQLWRDRRLSGVHWAPTMFFAGWGAWNLFYYPALGQWLSFAGGLAVVAVNAAWLLTLAALGRCSSPQTSVVGNATARADGPTGPGLSKTSTPGPTK